MCPNNGKDAIEAGAVAVEEILCRFQQRFDGLEQLTVCHFTAELPPEHFNRIEPGAVH
jgi:hypothetical protein